MTVDKREWTKTEIEAFLTTERLRYQAIDLPFGLTTGGSRRDYLTQEVFGDNFKGKTLLDIGSFLGYFCIEAEKRGGAGTGLEAYPESIRLARTIAEITGTSPRYIQADFEEYPGEERYDVVLCLNVLHHFYDPIHALHKMVRMAREKIVLEVASLGAHDIVRGNIPPSALLARSAPMIAMGRPRNNLEILHRSYLFTAEALRLFFESHYGCFESVDVRPSDFKGRLIVVARKRSIKHLFLVAGATAAGKSTFISTLMSDAGRAMRQQIGLADDAIAAPPLPTGALDHVVYHYDYLRPFDRSFRTFGRDTSLHLLDVAERVTFLTLDVPDAALIDQFKTGEIDKPFTIGWKRRLLNAARRRPQQPKSAARHKELFRRYQQPGFLKSWFDDWRAFAARYTGPSTSHWRVVRRDGYALLPMDDDQRQASE